ncbi:hypothetical protein MSUIS_01930 [Mycoplasma suis KI3806]|uniref:Uncharacterized protein n=1 Tax=Mycoplasma suis (strain KI_3806) TaxID=708248 RepID=F0V364_MYCS3|nr:hypothetical protein [Mycoplasma suis]CBZ40286.1 hypothetical protein MSUIS_01930 [Mycoplasma suis KI3806]
MLGFSTLGKIATAIFTLSGVTTGGYFAFRSSGGEILKKLLEKGVYQVEEDRDYQQRKEKEMTRSISSEDREKVFSEYVSRDKKYGSPLSCKYLIKVSEQKQEERILPAGDCEKLVKEILGDQRKDQSLMWLRANEENFTEEFKKFFYSSGSFTEDSIRSQDELRGGSWEYGNFKCSTTSVENSSPLKKVSSCFEKTEEELKKSRDQQPEEEDKELMN